MPITTEQIAAGVEVASDVFDKKLRPVDGVEALHAKYGLNRSSARDYISQYRSMMHGEVFKRTMSAAAIEYFLAQILNRRGKNTADLALSAAWKHVTYYENLQGSTQHLFRSALDAFRPQLSNQMSLIEIEKRFSAGVAKSLQDTAEARLLRLQAAKKTPISISITTNVYLRNYDVVAEVLIRAKGECERCRRPAPFTRKKDGTPYLEVHHKVQLSEDGDDSVENAVALCPNCHRQEHYG